MTFRDKLKQAFGFTESTPAVEASTEIIPATIPLENVHEDFSELSGPEKFARDNGLPPGFSLYIGQSIINLLEYTLYYKGKEVTSQLIHESAYGAKANEKALKEIRVHADVYLRSLQLKEAGKAAGIWKGR